MNDSLPQAGVATTKFDNWFVGANLGRQVGQHVEVNFNYGATEQNNPATCLVASCGGTGLQQTIGLSINWHLRPAG
jgi:acetyl-CoA carboxylase beta subunit